MNQIWFCSDFHFGHNKDFIYKHRGFSSIEEHDEKLIENFNSKVKECDKTYFLGDFSFSNNIGKYLNRLNGKFICINGNHDKSLISYYKNTKQNKIESFIYGFLDTYINNQPITLCHFPMRFWEKSHYGAWHLHGHIHDKTDFEGKVLNVSMDNINCNPINFDELTIYMNKRPNNPLK